MADAPVLGPAPELGIHCDVRRGFVAALRRAEALGCGAMQILPYRRHHEPSAAEFEEFRAARAASALTRLVVHVRFLPFLASTDRGMRERSEALLAREMRFCAALGGEFLILHLGAYSPGSTLQEGQRLFAEGAARAFGDRQPPFRLLVENVPGGGRRMGGAIAELAGFAEELKRRGFSSGFCLDTAHAWAYGYDLASEAGAESFLAEAERFFGAAGVGVFHLNDSMAERGSNREHHWHWGRGRLGEEGIRRILKSRLFQNSIGILETPPGADAANLDWIRTRL